MVSTEARSRSSVSHSAVQDEDTSESTTSSEPEAPLNAYSLYKAVRARKAEYTRQQTIRVKVGTWNVAAIPGTEEDVGKWFVQRKGVCKKLSGLNVSSEDGHSKGGSESDEAQSSDQDQGDQTSEFGGKSAKSERSLPLSDYEPDEVGIYALGLQEIVDVSSPSETLRPYVDSAPSKRWKTAVQKALPKGYKLISETQLVGLLLLIYAAPSVVDNVSSVSSSHVGTGLLGYMGNKGAVSTRILLGETTCLMFINSHLAAGSDKGSLERRNWDASQIVARSKFQPIDANKNLRGDPTESIGKEDFSFWFGDLNYRLEDISGDDVRQVFARHTQNEYDRAHKKTRHVRHGRKGRESPQSPDQVVLECQSFSDLQDSDTSSEHPSAVSDEDVDPRNDPRSLQITIESLLPHDQLRMQQQKGKAFHEGWREGSITFLPTYKYDVGSVARFDSSEKHRGPSWCDRILYRTRRDKLRHERQEKEIADARKKDEEMKARGLDKDASDDSVLFDYDPDVDGADSGDEYDSSKDQSSDKASFISLPDSEDAIRLDYYLSHQGILSSDHKPLDAGFTLTFESVVPKLKSKVHQEVIREFDKAENESRPGLTVVVDYHGDEPGNCRTSEDPNAVDLGCVAFNVPVSRSLTVANTSGVPATFSFENPNREGGAYHRTPPWLTLNVDKRTEEDQVQKGPPAQERTLFPGELAHIGIRALVQDIEQVRQLNSGMVNLEEILVLRVNSGRDHFISVVGKWLPTCFGRSVDDLTRMPEAGARSLADQGKLKASEEANTVRLSAPRELFRLTEAIAELTVRAVAEWSMTTGATEQESPPWMAEPHGTGWPFVPETWQLKHGAGRAPLLVSVREALDTNQSLTNAFLPEVPSLHRLEVLCETLQVFLHSLSDGIVTAPVWRSMEQKILDREKAKAPPLSWEETQAWVLENLADSPAHSVSFTFITFMLARVVNEVAPASPLRARRAQGESSEEQSAKEAQSSGPSPASTAAFISGGSFRRNQRSQTASSSTSGTSGSTVSRRATVEAALATRFTNFLIRDDGALPNKERDRRALEDRKRSIVEPFLKTIGVDDDGPSGGAK